MDLMPFFEEHEYDLNLLYLQKLDRQWKFRCPICGDSEHDETATRGDFFFDWGTDGIYKCIRCGRSLNPKNFILEVNSNLITEFNRFRYRFNLDDDYEYGQTITESVETVEHVESKQLFETKTIEELGFSFIEDEQIGIIEYLDSRGLSKDNFLYDIKTDRLVIPYYNDECDIYYYQLRSLKDNVKNKYMFDKSRQINENNRQRNIFNIYHVDSESPIQLLEGAIDSLLVENAVGNSGIGNIEQNIKFIIDNFKINKNNIYLILDFDNAGFEMMLKLSHEYYVFDWVQYFKDNELDYTTELEKVDINKLYLDMKRTSIFTFDELKPYYVKYSRRLEHQYKSISRKFSDKIKQDRYFKK